MKNYIGIILKRYTTKNNKVAVLDKQLGRIEGIVTSDVSVGSLLWYTTWTSFKGLVRKREMPYYNWTAHFWTPEYSPTGLTWDGAYLWLADDEADSLYKIEVKITEVKESLQVPVSFDIKQNYPKPFNPSTTISFSSPEKGYVTL